MISVPRAIRFLSALALAATLGSARAEPEARRFSPHWERTLLHAPEARTAERPYLGRFLLDAHLFAHTRDDFADLRLFDEGGHSAGLQVLPMRGSERHCADEAVSLKRLSLKMLGDTAFEAVYFAEKPARVPDRIFVTVEDRDFEISMSVWTAPAGSEAQAVGGPWVSRLSQVPLFDYSRFVDLRVEEARWDAGSDRALRLRVDGLTSTQRSRVSTLSGRVGRPDIESFQIESRLLRVDAISFSAEACEDRPGGSLSDTVELPLPGLVRPLREPERKRTWFVFPAGRLPLKSLAFRIGTPNFLRQAVLCGLSDSLVSPEDTSARPWTWPRIAEGRLYRLGWAGGDSSLRLSTSSVRRFATLALGVSDQDDAPLVLQGVGAEYERTEALFPAQGGEGYVMRYGDAQATPMRFDFADQLERGPRPAAEDWRAGDPRALTPAEAMAGKSSGLPGNLLLTLGLGLAIAALTVLVVVVGRKAAKQPVGPDSGDR